jgi:hypothetical protein
MTNIHTPHNRFFLQNRMEMFQNLDEYLSFQYSEIIKETVLKYKSELSAL